MKIEECMFNRDTNQQQLCHRMVNDRISSLGSLPGLYGISLFTSTTTVIIIIIIIDY